MFAGVCFQCQWYRPEMISRFSNFSTSIPTTLTVQNCKTGQNQFNTETRRDTNNCATTCSPKWGFNHQEIGHKQPGKWLCQFFVPKYVEVQNFQMISSPTMLTLLIPVLGSYWLTHHFHHHKRFDFGFVNPPGWHHWQRWRPEEKRFSDHRFSTSSWSRWS